MSSRWDHYDESAAKIRPNKRGSRPRTKRRPSHDDAVIGRIITVDRGRYRAEVRDGGQATEGQNPRVVTAVRAKSLRRTAIVPGDEVQLIGDISGAEGSLARLVGIQPRSSVLRRSADDQDTSERVIVANADQLLICIAADRPQPRHGFVDRALVAAFDAGIRPALCVTKADLLDPEEFLRPYRNLELPIFISHPVAENCADIRLREEFLAELKDFLHGHLTVLLGHSGVGKSTIVNALTGAQRATSAVNDVTGRGRHTSSSALALALAEDPQHGWVIDTPGVRSLGLAHIPEENIVAGFAELAPVTADCPKGCLHQASSDECALNAWVDTPQAPAGARQRLDSLHRLLLSRSADADHDAADTKELGV